MDSEVQAGGELPEAHLAILQELAERDSLRGLGFRALGLSLRPVTVIRILGGLHDLFRE